VQPQAAIGEPEPQATDSQAAELQLAEPQLAEPEPAQNETEISAPNSAEAGGTESATPAVEESPGENGEQTLLEDNPALALESSDTKSGPNSERLENDAANQPTVLAKGTGEPATEEPAAELSSTTPDALTKPEDPPNPEDLANPEEHLNLEVLTNRDDPAEPSPSGGQDAVIPPPITNPDRLAPSTSMVGSARDQVHEDGSLIKPKGKGPLAGLRERLAS
jgi:hypothetical protein